MEGNLKKWINVVLRWQDRYCILNDHILYYCEQKGGSIKGQIHLQVASIILIPDDPLRIVINTGTNEILLRAGNVSEKIEWVNALKRSQEECLATPIRPQDHFKKINEILTDLWVSQAAFDETLSLLIPRLDKQRNLQELAKKLQEQGQTIKMNATLCTGMLEEEKEKLEQTLKQEEYEQENGTLFQSFNNDRGNSEIFGALESSISLKSLTPTKDNQMYAISEIVEQIRYEQPIKYKNIINNQIFQKLKFTNAKHRNKLPRIQDPNEQIKIWSLLKDLIGKDLTKFAVPVYFNEPLSMLQRLAENIEYYQLLITANKQEDQWLRMCYIMGFGVSPYASNINRHKKPFNPILGETYEIQNKQFRFVSEQVSHHPPISAGFGESSDFEFWIQTDLKSKISPRCMEIQPLGSQHVILKKYNDHIGYSKCLTKVHNIIFGQMYIDHIGDMVYTNYTTKDVGILTLSGDHKVTGIVKDSQGKEKYKLRGSWNDSLIAQNVQNGKETIVWKKYELPQDSKMYYYFTNFALNLNHLNVESLLKLPATDCRLRPDQLALENGYIDLASEEKTRLEQKQRQRRNDLQLRGQHHEPAYFQHELEPFTNEMFFKFKGNYWRRQQEGFDLF